MKKVLALLVVCFMALGARLAMADTRTDALGLVAGQQVDDLDSIWLFPQDASNFGNVVDLRLGDPNGSMRDWGGIIHKDFDDIGYIGVYVNRPFNQNNGITPNENPAELNGIMNSNVNWYQMINPNYNSYWGSTEIEDPNGNTGSHYPVYPFAEGDAKLGYYANHFEGFNVPEISVADPQNKADIFWSKNFTDITLGAHFNYAHQTGNDPDYGDAIGSGTGDDSQGTPTLDNSTTSTFNADSSVIGLDLGLTLNNLGPNMSLGLGLGYSAGSVNYVQDYNQNYITAGTQTPYYKESITGDNISELRVNALLKDKMNDTTTGRIYGNARIGQVGFNDNAEMDESGDGTFGDEAGEIYKGTATYTDTNIDLGIACDHNVADGKAKVVAGLGIIYDGRKWTNTAYNNAAGSTTADQVLPGSGSYLTEDWWMVPFNVAIEAPIFDWLTGRIGASKNLYSNITMKYFEPTDIVNNAFTDNDTLTNSVDYGDNLNLSYGASAKFNNLTLDLQLQPAALLNYAKNFAPGQGVVYGNTTNGPQTGSSAAQLFATITQVDMRYSF